MKSIKSLTTLLLVLAINCGVSVYAHCGHCHDEDVNQGKIATDTSAAEVEQQAEKVTEQADKDAKSCAKKADDTVVYPKSYVQEGYEDARKVLDTIIKSYATRDLQGVLNTISDEKDVVFVTAGLQVFIGKEEISNAFEKDFDKISSMELTIPWSVTSGEGNTAWVTSIILANLELLDGTTSISARQTLVLHKEAGGWKIVASHFSYPAYRPTEKDTVEEIKTIQTTTQDDQEDDDEFEE